jgi:DNA-binding response OmpR family regulator
VNDESLRRCLAGGLRQDDYLVLEAGSTEELLRVVIRHSRPIQVLLLDVRIGGPELSSLLNQYRAQMKILIVTESGSSEDPAALAPESALKYAREILRPV